MHGVFQRILTISQLSKKMLKCNLQRLVYQNLYGIKEYSHVNNNRPEKGEVVFLCFLMNLLNIVDEMIYLL